MQNVKSFSGAKVKDMEHYLIISPIEQKPNITVMHTAGNNIYYKNMENVDINKSARNIVNISKNYSQSGVSDIVISDTLTRIILKVRAVIAKVNNKLDDLTSHLVFILF